MSTSATTAPSAAATPGSAREDAPWHAAFPTPRSSLADGSLASMTPRELKDLMEQQQVLEERDFLVVDVRRTDFENACIKGAINLPAHSFYPTLPALVPILSRYRQVFFHCQSSSGRGPRCAAWYQDYLNDLDASTPSQSATEPPESGEGGEPLSKAVVLEGGIKAWVKEFGDDETVTVAL
ncbi:hypothetical protein JCM10212_000411 [Sporobolomyces blumeae]